jgi:hypothetical protein
MSPPLHSLSLALFVIVLGKWKKTEGIQMDWRLSPHLLLSDGKWRRGGAALRAVCLYKWWTDRDTHVPRRGKVRRGGWQHLRCIRANMKKGYGILPRDENVEQIIKTTRNLILLAPPPRI